MDAAQLDALVERLRRQGHDDATVEVKASAARLSKSVWESVSAFANTDGGRILLGLDENTGFAPAKGFDPDRVIQQWIAGISSAPGTKPQVVPVPDAVIERHEVDGAPVVLIEVESIRGDLRKPRPCYVYDQGVLRGSYKRVDDHDQHLTPYEVYVLETSEKELGTDRSAVEGAGITDLDDARLQETIHALRERGSRVFDNAADKDETLRRINVVTADAVPTLAGLLTFGNYPQQFFPRLVIDVTVHPSSTKSSGNGQARFLDRRVCDGPLPSALDDAIRTLLNNLKTRRVVKGADGRDVPEIPEEVLREALVNAVAHRDYSLQAQGQPVSVDVFPNRIEVSNPGGLFGDRTVRNIDEGRSISRNPTLAQLLTVVPRERGRGSLAESQGSGVPRMINAMVGHGLPRPEYKVSIAQVTVILYRFGLSDPETREWLANLEAAPFTVEQEAALSIARTEDNVTASTLRDGLGLDSDDARGVLEGLTELGLLEPTGGERFELAHDLRTPSGASIYSAKDIRAHMDTKVPRTAKELAEATGRSINAVRNDLRMLVASGQIVATAPPTSRHRAYLLPTAAR